LFGVWGGVGGGGGGGGVWAHLCEGKDSSCERHGVGCVEREREREVGGCCCYERL
jgi:hypothetical protein